MFMKKAVFVILVFTLWCSCSVAQSWEQLRKDPLYLTGEGYGGTVEEADKHALSNLISQISVQVKSDMTLTEDEVMQGDKAQTSSYLQKKVQTFSEATLNNAQRLILQDEPDAKVGRYILKSDLHKVFEARRQKMTSYIRQAQKAEERGKIDDALRQYYWAFTLLKTLPSPNNEQFADDNGTKHTIITWIPMQMNGIFDDIEVRCTGRQGSDAELSFRFRGRPITSLDYTYSDGKQWSNIYSARDGRGVLELPSGIELNTVRLRYEYAYRGEAHIDREVAQVLEVITGKPMRKAYADLSLTTQAAVAPTPDATPSFTQQTVSAPSASHSKAATSAGEVVERLVQAIKSGNHEQARQLCTAEGAEIYDRLIHYGKAKVLNSQPALTYSTLNGQTIVRSIPMSFAFEHGSRKAFVENVVLTLDSKNRIDNITFGLGEQTTTDIMGKTVWPVEAREQIIGFMETYQTAFALERLDYIRTIFADDATIIVGKVARRVEATGDGQKVVNKYIQRTQLTKEQYIKHLAACFDSNEFVNIRFGSTDVTKAGKNKGEIYGIQLKQDYYSTHYGDSGYLYLQVDMTNPDEPVIRVRTWQEEPDPELGRVYGMEDF